MFLHFTFDYIPWKFKSQSLDEMKIKKRKKEKNYVSITRFE